MIILGVVAVVAILGIVGYTQGWFESEETEEETINEYILGEWYSKYHTGTGTGEWYYEFLPNGHLNVYNQNHDLEVQMEWSVSGDILTIGDSGDAYVAHFLMQNNEYLVVDIIAESGILQIWEKQ